MQLKQALPQPDVAVQFLSTVSSSTTTVEKRPKMNPSVDELHKFTLFTQILDTAKEGRDAGTVCVTILCGTGLMQNMHPSLCSYMTLLFYRLSTAVISGW